MNDKGLAVIASPCCLCADNVVVLSCSNVLVQRGADGTLAGIEFLDHAFYLFAQTYLK
jgi:hypothetical protein